MLTWRHVCRECVELACLFRTHVTRQLRDNDLRLLVGISSKNRNKWSTFGNMKKLYRGCNQTFESFSSKHLMFGHDLLISWKLWISRHASALERPWGCSFGSVGMSKYDWLSITDKPSLEIFWARWNAKHSVYFAISIISWQRKSYSPNGRVIDDLCSPDFFDTRLGLQASANAYLLWVTCEHATRYMWTCNTFPSIKKKK